MDTGKAEATGAKKEGRDASATPDLSMFELVLACKIAVDLQHHVEVRARHWSESNAIYKKANNSAIQDANQNPEKATQSKLKQKQEKPFFLGHQSVTKEKSMYALSPSPPTRFKSESATTKKVDHQPWRTY